MKNAGHLIATKLKKNAIPEERAKHKERQTLYEIIISLPDQDKVANLERNYNEVIQSVNVGEILKTYMREQWSCREKWAKCFISKVFTAGIYTTSRVESFNGKLKSKVRSNCQLIELLPIFDEICNHNDKFVVKISKSEQTLLNSLDLFKSLSIIYTPYVVKKVKFNTLLGLQYKIIAEDENYWYTNSVKLIN